MTIQEQNTVKTKYYNEAIRYMDNAKETLKKAGKEDNRYKDDKYVKTACGIAYNGVLKALDGLFEIQGIQKTKGCKSIEYYENGVSKINTKLNTLLKNIYSVLHLSGYYDGVTNVKIITAGLEDAYTMIDVIKPSMQLSGETPKKTIFNTKRKKE